MKPFAVWAYYLTKLGRIVLLSVAFAGSLGLTPLSPLRAATLNLDELKVIKRNDLFGSDDEIYLMITVARADGTHFAYRQPLGNHWTLRSGQSIFNQHLWQEQIPIYGRSLITVTILENDGADAGAIDLSAQSFATKISEVLKHAQLSPLDGALNPQFLSRLTPAVQEQWGAWGRDDVIGMFVLDYFNNGYQTRAGISALSTSTIGWVSPSQTRGAAFGEGSHYTLGFSLWPY